VRNPWQEFGWGEVDEPGPQTESSIERGFRLPGPIDDQWGRSDNLDPDNVGDIADEGQGHRGKAADPMRRFESVVPGQRSGPGAAGLRGFGGVISRARSRDARVVGLRPSSSAAL
jgi:hypothetical protein